MVDADPILNPKKQPQPRLMYGIDLLSWWLPAIAGVLSILAGLAALGHIDVLAASLGIAGGAASGFGVFFANWAACVRDERLKIAYALASLGVERADQAQRSHPIGMTFPRKSGRG